MRAGVAWRPRFASETIESESDVPLVVVELLRIAVGWGETSDTTSEVFKLTGAGLWVTGDAW